jgi:CubicO group peptidase (beta-lactamase class C family)
MKADCSSRSCIQEADPFREVTRRLEQAVKERVFPGAVLLLGTPDRVLYHQVVGRIDPETASPYIREDTIFDLASLTKPLAAALAVLLLVQDGRLEWKQRLSDILESPSGSPVARFKVTLSHLLSHSSGLPAFRPYYFWVKKHSILDPKVWIRERLMTEPLLYAPGERSLYSDLDFMLLEWVVEKVSGQPLNEFVKDRIYGPLGLERTGFWSKTFTFPANEFASTGWCRFRRQKLQGIVHDRNAWVMGGVSGHAGLFSTARDLWNLLGELYRSYDRGGGPIFDQASVRQMWTRQKKPPQTTWALGFDTPSEKGSSAGDFFPKDSIGHLGFTGCSFWLDLSSGLMIILLTNRIALYPPNTQIRHVRPLIHDLAYRAAQKLLEDHEQ